MCDKKTYDFSGYWITKLVGLEHDGERKSEWANLCKPLKRIIVYRLKQNGIFVENTQLAIIQTAPVGSELPEIHVTTIPHLGVFDQGRGCRSDSSGGLLRLADSDTPGIFELHIDEEVNGVVTLMSGTIVAPGVVVGGSVVHNAYALHATWKRVSKEKAKQIIKKINKDLENC